MGSENFTHQARHDFGIAQDTSYAVNEHASQILCDAMERAGIKNVIFHTTVATNGDS